MASNGCLKNKLIYFVPAPIIKEGTPTKLTHPLKTMQNENFLPVGRVLVVLLIFIRHFHTVKLALRNRTEVVTCRNITIEGL